MIRKATAFVLLIVLGLYLPAAGMTACDCLDHHLAGQSDHCCDSHAPPSQAHEDASAPCCGGSDCHIPIPGMHEGLLPEFVNSPTPVSPPPPAVVADGFATLPLPEALRAPVLIHAPPPPPGAHVRIVHGVWRL